MPLAFAVAAAFSVVAAQEQPVTPPPMRAPVLEYRAPFRLGPIELDGKLDDAAWRNVPWTSDFVDIEGSLKPLPRYRTRARMMWDDEYFYIAAEMQEPDVWGSLKNHDDIVFRDNDFEVFIDPNGDAREYYELEVNCLGTIFDLFLPRTYVEGGPAVHTWNCKGLKTHIHVDGSMNDPRNEDTGWTLEWAIPWKSFVPPTTDDKGAPLPPSPSEAARSAAAPKPGDTWRVNFSRVQWKHNFEELDEKGMRVGPKDRPRTVVPNNNSVDQAPPPNYEKRPNLREDNWVWSPQWLIDMHRPDRWGKVTFVKEDPKLPGDNAPLPPARPTEPKLPTSPLPPKDAPATVK
jgi:hypothetical protein